MPDARELSMNGILPFRKGKGNGKGKKKACTVAEALARYEKAGEEHADHPERTLPLMAMGAGLAALPKKLCDKILANDYNIDFSKLPPAKRADLWHRPLKAR